ncbi:MAG: hypothetical protein FJ190_03480 [Gammaproteobacteria bacterium]|nr:hypothetical protein [Gammaproteobacteria bacterium]
MIIIRQLTLPALVAALLLPAVPAYAVDDYYAQQLQYQKMLQRQNELREKMEHDRFVRQVGDKALNGFTNMVSGPLEMPKSIINQVNYNYGGNSGYSNNRFNNVNSNPDDNIVYGVIGGVISGALNATGRIMTGFTDLITAPLPTKQIIQPRYVWDDFDKTNAYGQVFRLVDNAPIEPYVPPPPRPVVAPEPVAVPDYGQQTNQVLDTYFQHEMRK